MTIQKRGMESKAITLKTTFSRFTHQKGVFLPKNDRYEYTNTRNGKPIE